MLTTQNEGWGFFGTMHHSNVNVRAAWRLAFAAVQQETKGTDEGVRDFLDSIRGRHFADDVANGLHAGKTLQAAIDAATTRWMDWAIGRRESRETGIPRGLPTLTGYVAHFGILAEVE